MRGLSDANGSWNTTCMRWRIRRSVSRGALSMRSSPRWISPSAIGCSASSAMPRVVLPEPDSPTIPSVSPRRSFSVAALTASKRRFLNQPSLIVKLTWTALLSTSTGASPATGSTTRCGRLAISLRVYGCVGCLNTSSVAPDSTRQPRSITPTRWVKRRTRLRSCVMKSTAMPISACSSSSSARICAWIVTSSAVVGSSQISSRGRQASAIAIMARCRWPPLSSCG